MTVKLVFETRAKCQDFVARYKDDGIPFEIDSPFLQCQNIYWTERLGNNLCLCGENWRTNLNFTV